MAADPETLALLVRERFGTLAELERERIRPRVPPRPPSLAEQQRLRRLILITELTD